MKDVLEAKNVELDQLTSKMIKQKNNLEDSISFTKK